MHASELLPTMQNHTPLSLLHYSLLFFTLLSFTKANLHCPFCGKMRVPYPISTSPNCGDPSYKVRCTSGKLWLDTLNGSSYEVTAIDPKVQKLTLKPPGFAGKTCTNSDYHSGGIWLDEKGPFNISSENTVLKLNCQPLAFQSPMNCSSNNICFRYLKENPDTAKTCGGTSICCSYSGGGSMNKNNIKVTPQKCQVYYSFVGLPVDTNLPVSKWPKPAIAINWALPPEPVCSSASDCKNLAKSSCLLDGRTGQRRCLCNAGQRWDAVNGMCSKVKCETKRCRKLRKRRKTVQALTCTGGAVLAIVSLVFLVYSQQQRIKREAREQLVKERQSILNSTNLSGRSAKLFSAKEIKRATSNFCKDNVLGSGGFGEVYKGKLDDGTIVAVKRAKGGNTKGTDQVLNEVSILGQVNHRCLVKLLGCCVELEQPALVYEYISNGTLHEHLHEVNTDDTKRIPLTWQQRLVIAQQTAQGLAYLHFSAVPPIFHRDIKSSNILLDHKLDAKVSDFGLSRLVDIDATHISTCAQGTLGYLDPQYYRNMQLTDKSDVYSFGVVLLELLTSQKAIDFNRQTEDVSIVTFMRKMVKQERLMDAVDPHLKESANKLELETMKSLGNLALTCLDDNRKNRPSMREVAEEIQYVLHILNNKGPKS